MLRKIIPGLAVATGVALIAGGAALAFGGSGDKPDEELLTEVAERLGVEPSVLQDAFDRAKRERVDEEFGEWLAGLVEAGAVTQEQAEDALEWIASRPAAADAIYPFGIRGAFLRATAGLEERLFAMPRHSPLGIHEFNLPRDVKEKLADRLGIDVDELGSAFGDVARETRIDALKAQVDRLLERGRISEDESAELKSWIDEMPVWLPVGHITWPFLDDGVLGLRKAPDGPRHFERPEGFVIPDGSDLPRFRFELRPHRMPFSVPDEVWPTPSDPEGAATGASRSA